MTRAVARRLRAIAGADREGRVERIASVLGIDAAGLPSRALGVAAAGVAAGALGFGAPGAAAGAPVALAAGLALARKRASARSERLEVAFPEAVRAIADAVRAGGNITQALIQAADEAEPPMRDELDRMVGEIGLGVPIEAALASFASRCAVSGADLLAVALSSGLRSGADIRPVLECITEAAADRRRLRRELRVSTAQGRMTALVVGGMPFAFLLVMGTGGGREIRFLVREPLGWLVLFVGCALEGAGFAWMRRLGRPA